MGESRTGRRWWRIGFRALVIGLWVLAASVTWWTSPRESTYEQARADIVERRVAAFQWGDHWTVDDTRRWFDAGTLYSSDTIGPLYLWRTGDGRVHWADTEGFDAVDVPADDAYAGPGATALARDIRDAGLDVRNGDVTLLSSLVAGIGLFLTLAFLMVLLVGPQPVLGTKGYWFWIGAIMPYGLGLLFWVLRDRPWADRPPAPGDRRDGWLIGIATGVLLSVLIAGVVYLSGQALGDRWIPAEDIRL